MDIRDSHHVVSVGCTWTFEILTMLLKGKAEEPNYSKAHVMLEASPPETIATIPSPRLLNTHLSYNRYVYTLDLNLRYL